MSLRLIDAHLEGDARNLFSENDGLQIPARGILRRKVLDTAGAYDLRDHGV